VVLSEVLVLELLLVQFFQLKCWKPLVPIGILSQWDHIYLQQWLDPIPLAMLPILFLPDVYHNQLSNP
jgi:hypothetical protein